MDVQFSQVDFGPLKQFLDNDDVTDISYSNNGCINLYNETKERYEKKKSFFIKNKVKMLREG